MAPEDTTHARPSPWWRTTAVIVACVAVVLIAVAVRYEAAASRPIGEGELFASDAAHAKERMIAAGRDPMAIQDEVRRVRNELAIEAVSMVDADGRITATTSETLMGGTITNPIVAFGTSHGVFSAAAMPIETAIEVDGVVEWGQGATLYLVGQPLDDGRSLLLHYDVSELLGRRSTTAGIELLTMSMLGLAAALVLLATILEIGRTRARAHMSVIQTETELLRRHGADLEIHNHELELARTAAEQALALAEEKNRIRAEFVLMINHELRTPLTSVLTGAHLLREVDLDPSDREQVLTDMLRDGKRLEDMISQILAVARIENRGLTSTMRTIDSIEVWSHLESVLPPNVVGKCPAAGVMLRTDPATLAALTGSLVDNARQHGATHVEVVADFQSARGPVSVGQTDDVGLTIAVIDDGPGISEAFLPRVFEKFEKDSFSSGTGLGLYVVRLMAEAIDASVDVTSSDSGTTFRVCVPAARVVELDEVSA